MRMDTSAAENVTVYISVERFTVGQGYIVTPTKLSVEAGTKVSAIVEQVLQQEGYEPDVETNSSYGWYLAGIYKADTGKVQVPVSVMGLDTYGYASSCRTGLLPSSENYVYPELAQFSYQADGMTSGWFYYVNHRDPGYGMAFYEVKDQDVIRLQFTLCMGDMAMIPDIDPATKSLAVIKEYLDSKADEEIRTISDRALEVLSDMDADKETISSLQDMLQEIAADLADGTKDDSWSGYLTEINGLYAQTKAQGIELRIKLLPDTVTLEDQKDIEDILSLYEALDAGQKQLVETEERKKLSSLVSALDDLKRAQQDTGSGGQGTTTQTKPAATTQTGESTTQAKPAATTQSKGATTQGQAAATTLAKSQTNQKSKETLKKKYTPAKVKITRITPGKKKVKLTWKKINKATGYQVQMSTKKSSGYKKIATIKKAKTVTYTKKKLKSKKTMYFRIRAYRKVGKVTYYGPYSAVKKAKVK